MAHKPGQVDLRCPEAVQSAFLLHSKYGKMAEAVEVGVRMVKGGNWAFAQYLPSADARRALDPCLAEIVPKQQRTGMWFRKNAEAYTYGILKALARADLLPELLDRDVLRYNPYQRFAHAPDEWGFLVRRNIMKETRSADGVLQAKLISVYTRTQNEDSSWGQTISGTALSMERLLELGMAAEDSHLTKGAEWLLNQFQESIKRRRPGPSLEITVRNLFTSPDCRAEHAGASQLVYHHTLASSCFVSIPIVQTALALRVLVRMGLENHAKVGHAFRSLLDMQTRPREPKLELPAVPVGQWCAHQCRFKLEEREKANRRLQRTSDRRR